MADGRTWATELTAVAVVQVKLVHCPICGPSFTSCYTELGKRSTMVHRARYLEYRREVEQFEELREGIEATAERLRSYPLYTTPLLLAAGWTQSQIDAVAKINSAEDRDHERGTT